MRKSNVEISVSDRQLEKELKRTTLRKRRWIKIYQILSALIVIAAILVLTTVLWFPVYHITGETMEPTLKQGQIVVASRMDNLESGDIAALYYENQILIRRIIGMPGDWIYIDDQGIVSVNDEPIEEYYLEETIRGSTDITYPYLVPDDCYFVMGDNRAVSVDSRLSFVGCIDKEKFAGKIVACLWPIRQVSYIG